MHLALATLAPFAALEANAQSGRPAEPQSAAAASAAAESSSDSKATASAEARPGAADPVAPVSTARKQDEPPVTVGVGGRIHLDTAFFSDEDAFDGVFGKLENASEVRRARFRVQGRMYDSVDYKVEVDLAGGEAVVKDVYLGVRGLPMSLRFGHQKEPWSIEEQTSSRFITFLERSLVHIFSPERSLGVRLEKVVDGRSSWSAGVFRPTDGFGEAVGDNYNLTARVTHAPILEDGGRRMLHLGAAYTHKFIDGDLKLDLRPDAHTSPKLVQMSLPATSADYLQGEVAANVGSLGLQAEYVRAWVSSVQRDDPSLSAWYVHGSYFLTGESRPYAGTKIDRLKPNGNFLGDGGSGAWEIAARYARADLSEGTESGLGEVAAFTAGINWYWNPNVRLMFNYTHADATDLGTDPTSIYQWRMAFDW